jgi:hypothetical protein
VPAFTLPEPYWPSNNKRFAQISNSAVAHVEIRANGEVWVVAGDNTWVSLDGISWETDL